MKVLGISIEANKAIFSALEQDASKNTQEISSAPTKLELKDHQDSKEVRRFQAEIQTFLSAMSFDKVGVITRTTKGRFAASPISFKIEGLIQLFPNLEIDFISPATLRAHFKKNENTVVPKYTYQQSANDLAVYLLS